MPALSQTRTAQVYLGSTRGQLEKRAEPIQFRTFEDLQVLIEQLCAKLQAPYKQLNDRQGRQISSANDLPAGDLLELEVLVDGLPGRSSWFGFTHSVALCLSI